MIGRTTAGAGLVLRNYATVRADGESVTLGERVFFGERACVHIWDSTLGTVLADDVTIARYALAHACNLGTGTVLAEGALVMDGAEVGPWALIAPGAMVPPRKKLPGGWVYAGSPAQPVREIAREEVERLARSIRAGTPAPEVCYAQLPPLDNGAFVAGATSGRLALGGHNPSVTGYVSETALLAGDVRVGRDAGVYFGCVLKADGGRIVVSDTSNVQDSSILDVQGGDLIIGPDVTVGHNVRLGRGRIGESTLVGMGAIVGNDVVVERDGCIAAGAWVEPGTVVKAGWIWAGRPARAFREIRPEERDGFALGRQVYVRYARAYTGAGGPPAAGEHPAASHDR